MDRDGNLPGFIRFSDIAGSRLGQDEAALTPRGGFGLTLVLAEFFQVCATRACDVSGARQ
jgi:hypothetical protein